MLYYIITNGERVVGKFDGPNRAPKNDHKIVTVDTLSELSEVTVDQWDEDYEEF